MGQLNKQEVQSLLETLKNRILEKTVTRQELQTFTETSRDKVMTYVHDLVQIHQQNMMRRQDVQNSQLTKRVAVLETRLITIEQELKYSRQLLERLVAQSGGQAQPSRTPANISQYNGYAYRQQQ